MKEHIASKKKRIGTGLTIVALGLSGSACGGNKDPQAITKTIEITAPLGPEIKGIKPGDNLRKVKVLEIGSSAENSNTIYKAKDRNALEDLVVIYSPRLSDLIKESANDSDTLKNTEIALMLSSSPDGEIVSSMVFFDRKTKEVSEVWDGDIVIPNDGPQPLYNNVYPPEEVGFTITVEPDPVEYGVRVVVKNVSSGESQAA